MSYQAFAEPFRERQGDASNLLTPDDLDVVLAMLAEITPCWTAELNQAGPGESTIVVMPEGANDMIGPAFVLHRSCGGVHLDQFRWDEYRKLGGFRGLNEALVAMRARLLPLVARQVPNAEGGLL